MMFKGKWISEIPTDCHQNDLTWKLTSFERIIFCDRHEFLLWRTVLRQAERHFRCRKQLEQAEEMLHGRVGLLWREAKAVLIKGPRGNRPSLDEILRHDGQMMTLRHCCLHCLCSYNRHRMVGLQDKQGYVGVRYLVVDAFAQHGFQGQDRDLRYPAMTASRRSANACGSCCKASGATAALCCSVRLISGMIGILIS